MAMRKNMMLMPEQNQREALRICASAAARLGNYDEAMGYCDAMAELGMSESEIGIIRGAVSLESRLFDVDRSINENAILFTQFSTGSWQGWLYYHCPLLDPAKKLRDYTPEEWKNLKYGPDEKVKMMYVSNNTGAEPGNFTRMRKNNGDKRRNEQTTRRRPQRSDRENPDDPTLSERDRTRLQQARTDAYNLAAADGNISFLNFICEYIDNTRILQHEVSNNDAPTCRDLLTQCFRQHKSLLCDR